MNGMLERARGSKVRRGHVTHSNEIAWVDFGANLGDQTVFVSVSAGQVSALPDHAIPVLSLADAEIERPNRPYAVVAATEADADFAARRGHHVILGAAPTVPGALHFPCLDAPAQPNHTTVSNEPIAIIGIGAVMPGANDAKTFWENIKSGVSAISEVPSDRWNPAIFHDENRDTPDKTYSKIGGWITGYVFDRKQFRMPPSVIEKIDPTQLICLTAVREALADAGYLDKDFARDRCAVILGNALGGDLRDQTTLRVHYPEIENEIRTALQAEGVSGDALERALERAAATVKSRLVEVNEDSMPGELANVIAGRVASAFDLHGPNYVVDAACASALAAVEAAVRGLRARQFDVAITGGSDRTMSPPSFVKFSKIGALSADGSRPFDANANGFVMGEGAGVLVLKRLSDAERDQDRIYAVIRGVGGASDGKGKGITAPNPRGQVLAMRRAWEDAGVSPRTATLIEAHGTSTPVGDPIEVASMRTVLDEATGEYAGEVRLGSVKSMIGHLKSAAGAAGMIKVAFALHDKVLPPTINVTKENPALGLDGSRLRLQKSTEAWKVNGVRRAGVSAFGFGGTNFHVVLEEYVPASASTGLQVPQASVPTVSPSSSVAAKPVAASGVLAFAGRSNADVRGAVIDLQNALRANANAYTSALLSPGHNAPAGAIRLAIAFSDAGELDAKLGRAAEALAADKGWKVLANQGIIYAPERTLGLIAMLSPGQGSQYLRMGSDLARLFPVVQATFDEADAVMQPILGRSLSSVISPAEGCDESEAFLALSQTEITQPAVLTVDVAIARLLAEFGVYADMVAGHSLGEYGACVAAGVMSFADALRTVAARGTEMAKATPMNGDCGIMASVPASVQDVEAVLATIDGYVVCANKNCPGQTIIAGLTEPTQRAMAVFEKQGLTVVQLPVSHAFHSKVVAAASEPLRRHLETIGICAPELPIFTNVTGDLYPNFDGCESAIRDLLAKQVAAPVEYIAMIERMYALGARTFVEVGPKRAQQAFVQQILGDRTHLAIHTNHPKKGELGSFFEALGHLWVSGAMDIEEFVVDAPAMRAAMDAPRAGSKRSADAARPFDRAEVVTRMIEVLCEKTGYDPAEIDPAFELEADLGIDTVKQAEIMAAVREIYGFERDDAFKLAQYPSLNHLADYVVDRVGGVTTPTAASVEAAPAAPAAPVATAAPIAPTATVESLAAARASQTSLDRRDVVARMIAVLCDKTGYDSAEIDPAFELEADLGIDTVKQAEIMAAVREIYGFERDDAFKLAQYPSLNHLADYVMDRASCAAEGAVEVHVEPAHQASTALTVTPAPMSAPVASQQANETSLVLEDVVQRMVAVLCEKTGYDPAEIDPAFELEADLGIDTVKQAEIMAAVREIYGFERDDTFKLAQHPSLNHLANYVMERVGTTAGTVPVAHATAPAPAITPSVDAAQTSSASLRRPLNRQIVVERMVAVLCDKTGYDPSEIDPAFELEADLGIDTVKQAEIMAAVREIYGFERDEAFKLAQYPSLNHLADYVIDRMGEPQQPQAPAPAVVASADASAQPGSVTFLPQPSASQSDATVPTQKMRGTPTTTHPTTRRVAITGCALGLPGAGEIFAEDTVDKLLAGVNFIGDVDATQKDRIVGKRIVRLVKGKDGGGEMQEVTSSDEVIKLAGRPGDFDVTQWGLPERLAESLDDTSQMAIAAGLIALQDAGLPLVPRYRTTTTGKKVTIGWSLPDAVAAETGVIFASAFAGQDALIDEVLASTEQGYQFNHRFLLRVLGIANSRFAEFVGARGPNTKINNACASTTTAMALAQDWISLGRCKRVVILGADNASGNTLFEWVGAGFLATGAASTEARVEDAALPFDRRRDGMIIGMGAVALVVEAAGMAEARGMEPIAEVLQTRFVNSALHPTRLDVDHIAGEVDAMLTDVEHEYAISRHDIAKKTVFVSHETYTPARGGSADAEIASLRRAFGAQADDVVIANTKGFTGHAMGAGIEDVLAIKALQRRRLPHIANFKEPDPNLGSLRLSQGGEYDLDYALRLAAGFGSQLALALIRFRARSEQRIVDTNAYRAWLSEVSGFEHPETFVDQRTLRLRETQPENHAPVPPPAEVVDRPMLTRVEPPQAHAIRPQSVVAQARTASRVDASTLAAAFGGKRVLIIAGPHAITDFVTVTLRQAGATVHILRDLKGPLNREGTAIDFGDEGLLQREILTLGPLDGIVNLLGFGTHPPSIDELERSALHTFHVARAWVGALGEPGPGQFFVSVTGMGGRLGFDRASGPLPVCGAVSGMTKALAREWPQATVKTVDIAREAFSPDLGTQLLSAIIDAHTGVEFGLLGGVQWAPSYIATSEIIGHGMSLIPRGGEAVLVTGGARGITAEIVRDLAKRTPATFVLVGRTPFEGDHVLAIDLEQKKAEIRAELQAQGKRVTPVLLNKELARTIAQQEIARTLAEIRSTGAQAEYVTCDLANPDDVKAMCETLQASYATVAGFIHGAGVEESRLLLQKDRAGFDRVFRGKALGGFAMWEALKSTKPRFAVFFSSVAGRFGNIGQTDYSAANDSLNKLAQLINATSETRALSIDWTAWDDIGMATEGSMKQILESRGIELLPAAHGAPMVGTLLSDGIYGEVLVAGRLGDLFDGVVEERVELAAVTRTTEKATFERTLSLDDPFMKDHVYEGNALLPGVMGLELMHEAARLLGHDTWVARGVRFDKAVKLLKDEPLKVSITAERRKDSVFAQLTSSRTTVTGRTKNETHFDATFTRTPDRTPAQWIINTQDAVEGPNHEAIYKRFFHTGVFRVLENVPMVTDEFVVAHGRVPAAALIDGKDAGQVSTQPLLTEMVFQAIGIWGMVHRQVTSLPHRIATWELFGGVQAGAPVAIRARKVDVTDTHLVFDAEVRDEFGHLVLYAESIELIIHQKLDKGLEFGNLERARGSIAQMNEPEARAWIDDHNLSLDDLLGEGESESWNRFLSERRKSEWLAARVAAKIGIAAWVRDVRGLALHPRDVVIEKDDNKAPYARLRGHMANYPGPLPHLSVAHSGGVAVVHVGLRTDMRIGVDLETVETREESFAMEYFTAEELKLGEALPRDKQVTVLWTIKEAVSKALGLGLHVRLSEIKILALSNMEGGWTARVDLINEAAQALANLRGESMDVRVFDLGNFVLAEATFDAIAEAREPEPTVTPEPENAQMFAAVAALLHHKGLLKTTPRTEYSRS